MGQSFNFSLVTAFNAVGLNISAEDFFKASNKNEFYSVRFPALATSMRKSV
jgi:hypothetical protein